MHFITLRESEDYRVSHFYRIKQLINSGTKFSSDYDFKLLPSDILLPCCKLLAEWKTQPVIHYYEIMLLINLGLSLLFIPSPTYFWDLWVYSRIPWTGRHTGDSKTPPPVHPALAAELGQSPLCCKPSQLSLTFVAPTTPVGCVYDICPPCW